MRDAEVLEDLGADSVVAEVGGVAEFFVGFDGVVTFLLKFVGFDFSGETDAAAFLAEVEEDAAFFGDLTEGAVELFAAVAAAGAEDVTSEALGVDANKGGGVGADRSVDEGEVVAVVKVGVVEVAVEVAVGGGKLDDFLAVDEFFFFTAIGDELGDGAGEEVVLFLVVAEFADAGHFAVFIHNFTNYGSFGEFGKAAEVERGFGVAGATEDSAVDALEGEDVAGSDEGVSEGVRLGEDLDGVSAVGGGDAGGDTLGGID